MLTAILIISSINLVLIFLIIKVQNAMLNELTLNTDYEHDENENESDDNENES